MSHIIEPDAITAFVETRKSDHPKLYGKKLVTRKNPPAIDVGSGLDLLVKH
jgi:hypothetical protein